MHKLYSAEICLSYFWHWRLVFFKEDEEEEAEEKIERVALETSIVENMNCAYQYPQVMHSQTSMNMHQSMPQQMHHQTPDTEFLEVIITVVFYMYTFEKSKDFFLFDWYDSGCEYISDLINFLKKNSSDS